MTLHFKYRRREVIEALRFHFMNKPEIKLFRTFLILLVIAAFIGYFTDYISLNALTWIFIIFIALVFLLWFILPFSVYRRAHTFREPELTLSVSEETLTIGTNKGKSRIAWQRFSNVMETKDFFYLYRSNKSFFLIPANAFNSKEDRITFSKMLQKIFSDYTFK